MRLYIVALLPLVVISATGSDRVFPKYRIEPIESNDTLLSRLTPPPEIEEVRAATFVGRCSPSTPFVFRVNGGAGRGAIGCIDPDANITNIGFQQEEKGEIRLYLEYKEKNFFALGDDSHESQGYPFRFRDVSNQGAPVSVECDADTGIVVLMRGTSSKSRIQVRTSLGQTNNGKLTIEHGGRVTKIRAESYRENSMAKNRRNLDVTTKGGNRLRKQVDSSSGDIVLLQMESLDDDNNLVQGSIIKKARAAKQHISKLDIGTAYINGDNDVVFPFITHQPADQATFLSYAARVGIEVDGVLVSEEIDVSVIHEPENAALTIHGGWIRRALALRGLSQSDQFDLVVTEAVATDPANGYIVVALLDNPATLNLKKNKNRRHLAMRPSQDELDITKEMRMGRRPDFDQFHGPGRRKLKGGNPKKIIVHGYCSVNSFPIDQFSPAIEYQSTYTTDPQGISNLEFARDLLKFTKINDITSCSMIGHSQGGHAAVTVHAHWWSCLDYVEKGTRLIQSVGSPYQGTPIAGRIPILGKIFGLGCGEVYDLTTKGAPTWLATIPSWAQEGVYYYTTTYADKSIWNDYCNLASDAFLKDPDDGATEDSRARLEYGVYMGITSGQCHTNGMRDPFQCDDEDRNKIMNATAKY